MTGADVALIITASGTVLIQAYNAWRGSVRDEKIREVHNLVNSMSQDKTIADKAVAHAEGKIEGAEEARAAPTVPGIVIPAAPIITKPTKL